MSHATVIPPRGATLGPGPDDGDLWTFGMFWQFGAFFWVYRRPEPLLGEGHWTVTLVNHFGQITGRSLIDVNAPGPEGLLWSRGVYLEHQAAIEAVQAVAYLGHPKTWRPPAEQSREHYDPQHERTAA